MDSRPATAADVPALLALQERFDTHWFGATEHDEGELREDFDRIDPLSTSSLLLLDGDRIMAAAWFWGTNSNLVADPDLDPQYYDGLIAWFEDAKVELLEALSTDVAYHAALTARGWSHTRSAFELIRTLTDDWVLELPTWPAGITLTGLQDLEQVHDLIYRRAAWKEVPGHHDRPYDEWLDLFATRQEAPEEQVLAWLDGELVGVAMGRIFSDGTGWVAQLAVDKAQRGRGLGKAMLLEALRHRVAAGATGLGLAVSAGNAGALGLYLSVGLTIDREWQDFRRIP